MNKKFLNLILPLFLVGCASQKYSWNNYDGNLYSYYKNPVEKEKFIERLKITILKGEQEGKVPPGIYAEYGYMLYENHDFAGAITYFKKEQDLWPESQYLMEKMIKNAQDLMAKTNK